MKIEKVYASLLVVMSKFTPPIWLNSGELPVHGTRPASRLLALAAALLATCLWAGPVFSSDQCSSASLALQVLGSGGPVADDGRSSSGYLLWVNGRARVLVDAGSGTFTRFGEAGADFDHLDIIALSHFHTDHAAALPALLKTGYFSTRSRPLTISGPSAGGPFPSLEQFLSRLLDHRSGAFGYLSGYLDGSGGLVKLLPVTVDATLKTPFLVYADDQVNVQALPVPHGIVPSLAYRIEAQGKTIVLGSDQNGSAPEFGQLALNVDLLVLHAVIPAGAGPAARALHATPSQLAQMAGAAAPGQLVLSHWMGRSLRVADELLAAVKEHYSGPISAADDLACFPLLPTPVVQ